MRAAIESRILAARLRTGERPRARYLRRKRAIYSIPERMIREHEIEQAAARDCGPLPPQCCIGHGLYSVLIAQGARKAAAL